jgi:hypothetical protein
MLTCKPVARTHSVRAAGADAFGDAQCAVRRHVGHQHDKLFAAKRATIRFPQRAADDGGHVRQHLVARSMAVAVIDRLEEIEVDAEQGQRLAVARQIGFLALVHIAEPRRFNTCVSGSCVERRSSMVCRRRVATVMKPTVSSSAMKLAAAR